MRLCFEWVHHKVASWLVGWLVGWLVLQHNRIFTWFASLWFICLMAYQLLMGYLTPTFDSFVNV